MRIIKQNYPVLAKKGGKIDGNFTQEIKDLKIETSYLNVPITASYYLFKGFAVKSGVQFGFLTSAKNKATLTGKHDNLNVSIDVDEDCKDDLKKFDISIPVGFSYEFKIPVVVDLRFNIGLTKVNKESDHDYKDSRNMQAALTVGYKFAL